VPRLTASLHLQRPYVLNGHSRSITFIKYNRDGDLLFSCGKDHTPCVWRGASGERIGTYNGHKGTVWGCDVTPDSTLLLTASADPSVKLWDVRTGRELFTFEQKGAARSVAWAEGTPPQCLDVPSLCQNAWVLVADAALAVPSRVIRLFYEFDFFPAISFIIFRYHNNPVLQARS
jgi:WD40 repeat protein